jgi:hypothetical protein
MERAAANDNASCNCKHAHRRSYRPLKPGEQYISQQLEYVLFLFK